MAKKANPLGQVLVFLTLSPVWLVLGTFWIAGWLIYALVVWPFVALFGKRKSEEVIAMSDRDA